MAYAVIMAEIGRFWLQTGVWRGWPVLGDKVTVGAMFLGTAIGAFAAPVAIGWTSATD